MELEKSLFFDIADDNLECRALRVSDVTPAYVTGLKRHGYFLITLPAEVTLESQVQYVRAIVAHEKQVLTGLFINNTLAGTAGLQATVSLANVADITSRGSTDIGILLFNEEFRGRRLGRVLVWSATYLFYHCTKIHLFKAGISNDNLPSLQSFLACGFRENMNDGRKTEVSLEWPDSVQPDVIRNVVIKNVAKGRR